jgi:hypothetical protein
MDEIPLISSTTIHFRQQKRCRSQCACVNQVIVEFDRLNIGCRVFRRPRVNKYEAIFRHRPLENGDLYTDWNAPFRHSTQRRSNISRAGIIFTCIYLDSCTASRVGWILSSPPIVGPYIKINASFLGRLSNGTSVSKEWQKRTATPRTGLRFKRSCS